MQWLNSVLENEYELVRVLRNSEKITIRHLRHRNLGQSLVHLSFDGDGEVYRLLQTVQHPHLPRIYTAQQEGDHWTVLEEFVDGITVAQVLESGLYSEKGARQVAAAVCEAAGFLHSHGFVHRDIKPENVMVRSNGQVVLLDFDTVRMHKPEAGRDTRVIGTAGYAAPEQFGVTQTDARADVYAIGIMLNVMLTGYHPTKQTATGRLAPLIEKCTRLDPDKRYQSVWELKEKLGY